MIRVQGATNGGGAWNGWNGLLSIISAEGDFAGYETHVGETISACALNSDWNAYYCANTDEFGVLLFESEDADA